MTYVIGLDSSTQSCTGVLADAATGEVVGEARVPHPTGTRVDPRAWLQAVDEVLARLARVGRAEAVAVGGQQHGMVALGDAGEPVHDALLWHDTRSAAAARALIEEMGGAQACAAEVGSVLVASFTVTKLRWLRDHDPAAASRVRSVLLPHDYVSWHLSGRRAAPWTDRGDASGTGYYATGRGEWRPDLAAAALGHEVELPRVVAPGEVAATTPDGQALAAGTGDNMAAALGTGLRPGDVLLSIGTSGVASTVSPHPVADGTGTVTGFAAADGGFLPMVTTMNAARILDLQAAWLGTDHAGLAALALESSPGAGGAVLLPYYAGERTPNRPDAVGTWTGLTTTTTRADLARAAVEALSCSLADAVDHLRAHTGESGGRVLLVGGAARSPAVQRVLPGVLGASVELPPPAEYVALGAARQAAWALSGAPTPPAWELPGTQLLEAPATPEVRERYATLRDRTSDWT
ncbi:FGGY family carbohydrate kinase [Nocardioides marinus]|uniref:Xylulose kinase n=1 Tax=Nocardioides marinus TaxID=374514 RepID=A0A7Z0C0W4_9ACTN|nr:xylulokinase [Nocardioides marinus]